MVAIATFNGSKTPPSKLKTGDKLKLATSGTKEIEINNKSVNLKLDAINYGEFILSIIGDVSGDGNVNKSDASTISKHIINNNTVTDEAKLFSADYNIDGKIKMNDVMKLLSEI